MNLKFGVLIWAMVISLSGCATDSPLRLRADSKINMDLERAQGTQRPNLASTDLVQLREAMRATQTPPTKPVVEERRFNLAVKDLSVAAAYQVIGEHAGLNVIVSSEIKDMLTIHLKNVTTIEALEALREAYGYEFELGGGRVTVNKPRLLSRTFQIDYLVGTRAGRSEVKVSPSGVGDASNAGSGNGSGNSFTGNNQSGSGNQNNRENQEGSKVITTVQNDFWRTLEAVLKSIVGDKEGQAIVINPQSGLVYVKAYPQQLRQIDEYLERTQVKVSRQVVLEAKIIEVTLSSESQGGINWASFNSAGNHRFSVGANGSTISAQGGALLGAPPLTGANGLLNAAGGLASAGGLGVAFTGTTFSALLNFLQSQGETQVLSAPRVATLNNQKAVLKVGTDEFFVTNVTSNTVSNGTATTSSPSINVQPFFSGIALDVTPQIDDRGYVMLHVHPSVSEVAEKSKVINLGGMGTYILPLASSNVNESDTVVRLLDGDIVAIGGLMSSVLYKDGKKVPFAGDVPIAGELFRQHRDSYRKTELVILIKPTVINKPSDWTSANPSRAQEMR